MAERAKVAAAPERKPPQGATAKQLLSAPKRMKSVKLDDGTRVWVREMSGTEFGKFTALAPSEGDELTVDAKRMAGIVAMTACDNQGQRLFTDDQVDDIAEMAFPKLQALFLAALEISDLTKDTNAQLQKK